MRAQRRPSFGKARESGIEAKADKSRDAQSAKGCKARGRETPGDRLFVTLWRSRGVPRLPPDRAQRSMRSTSSPTLAPKPGVGTKPHGRRNDGFHPERSELPLNCSLALS